MFFYGSSSNHCCFNFVIFSVAVNSDESPVAEIEGGEKGDENVFSEKADIPASGFAFVVKEFSCNNDACACNIDFIDPLPSDSSSNGGQSQRFITDTVPEPPKLLLATYILCFIGLYSIPIGLDPTVIVSITVLVVVSIIETVVPPWLVIYIGLKQVFNVILLGMNIGVFEFD